MSNTNSTTTTCTCQHPDDCCPNCYEEQKAEIKTELYQLYQGHQQFKNHTKHWHQQEDGLETWQCEKIEEHLWEHNLELAQLQREMLELEEKKSQHQA